MKVKNNTGAPQLFINWRHLFLVGIHLFGLVWSVLGEPIISTEGAARALP